jgi:hypothetical protein
VKDFAASKSFYEVLGFRKLLDGDVTARSSSRIAVEGVGLTGKARFGPAAFLHLRETFQALATE